MKRTTRFLILAGVGLGAAALLGTSARKLGAQLPEMTVYRNASCGCCENWARAMRENGWQVDVVDVVNLRQFKVEQGVPESLRSCHTAVVDGHILEGHVPPDVAVRIIGDLSEFQGIAVAGMPRGSTGMEGTGYDSYQVIGFKGNGEQTVLAAR